MTGVESGTLGTLAIAFDDIVTESFTFRGTQRSRHVRLGGPGPCIASGTAPDITYMDSYGHAFASKYCTLTSAGFLSVECSDNLFCKVYVAAESVGFAQQIESSGMAGRGASANCRVEAM